MDKIISSSIKRSFNKKNDELYELLKVVPAKPIVEKPVKPTTCEFQPRNDKKYIPKKKIWHKVKTVRDIRTIYEKDVLSELPAELEKQQSYILRKIKGGFIKDVKTRTVAKSMLTCDKPLTKSTWQMLMNINPEGHPHSMQYVLWNGKSIRVNGSKGGKSKFICKYDLARNKSKNISGLKKKITNKRNGSLLNSLSVDFKPGPLTRKKYLDNSYQKYHVGHVELVNLPKPGLEIQPSYENALDPTISCFVNKLRDENGSITRKWAEFAVSVLGTVNQNNIKQIDTGSSVTFDLTYKHDQERLLMRRDFENKNEKIEDNYKLVSNKRREKGPDVLPEVRIMMAKLIDAVEINLCQDDMSKEDDEVRAECHTDQPASVYKEKLKRRYCELDRLDVTVIRLNENESSGGDQLTCKNSYCALGCICSSLQSSVVLKGHCGRIDCMFDCKCDFSKLAMVDAMNSGCSELLPGLFNLNNEINCSLSKEEQKFHQTVIVSGDKSILLKSKKRNCKSSKKYEDYYNTLDLKSKSKLKPVLTIIEPKLNCENIEPWCMVHNLYKCFCKGRFTEMSVNDVLGDVNKKVIEVIDDPILDNLDETEETDGKIEEKDNDFSTYRPRSRREKRVVTCQQVFEIDSNYETNSCARITKYEGRKYSEGYYLNACNKILEMERNDTNLRQRLQNLVHNSADIAEGNVSNSDDLVNTENEVEIKETQKDSNISIPTPKPNISIPTPEPNIEPTTSKITMIDESAPEKSISNKPKLVAWLESSYQQYKRRLDRGVSKTTLEPPKKGKVALYPWDFILNRYSERKNLFMVSKQAPYRIFMAVNNNNPLFDNCINIDDIRFAELPKYPTTVKSLLTNTNNMKDYFCILYGYNHCWEFIGTVTKVSDQKDNSADNEESKSTENDPVIEKCPNLLVDIDPDTSIAISSAMQEMNSSTENTPKQSKWFIMTVENDFTEIQFYNRGFFVKYKSIVKAINVARVSGKTVRLSSQKCAEKKPDETQFGIYAIPNSNEYCVFIGPYELKEPLGIETVKTFTHVGNRNRTRGIWITTDKVDNLKVIDNPLSFIPSQRPEYKDFVPVGNPGLTNDNPQSKNDSQIKQDDPKLKPAEENARVVKPIKISKCNGFYHLGPSALIKTVSVLKSPNKQPVSQVMPKTLILKSTTSTNLHSKIDTDKVTTVAPPIVLPELEGQPVSPLLAITCAGGATVNRVQNKPVAEVAPQIKIAAVSSESNKDKTAQKKRKEGSMFILKPEEINERLIIDGNKSPKASSSKADEGLDMDIEHFLGTSTICTPPENETYIISDDDEDVAPNKEEDEIKEIYLECSNIENLGALVGEQHKTKGVRFEFPGFKISDYYAPEEVFSKINQVMSRRVYIPNDLKLEWQIVDCFSKLKTQRLMKRESFGANLIMTKHGIKMKSLIKDTPYTKIKTYRKKKNSTIIEALESDVRQSDQNNDTSHEFEKGSQALKVESTELSFETVTKKNDK